MCVRAPAIAVADALVLCVQVSYGRVARCGVLCRWQRAAFGSIAEARYGTSGAGRCTYCRGCSCTQCGALLRPWVYMFFDDEWIPNTRRERAYVQWECAVETALRSFPQARLVILEVCVRVS